MPHPKKLILLVTGDSHDKDYCANIWAKMFGPLTAQVISISDLSRRGFAKANKDVNLWRLMRNVVYTKQHRPALIQFFLAEVQTRPLLLEERFVKVVFEANVDVLLIIDMRDGAPFADLWHAVPDYRLLDIRVEASKNGAVLGGRQDLNGLGAPENKPTVSDYRPYCIFQIEDSGQERVIEVGNDYLLPWVHEDFQRLADMVPKVSNFPRAGLSFRNVLNISRQKHGLRLCTKLLRTRFTGQRENIGAIVGCDLASGYVYATALAIRVDVPLVLIRKDYKLPPPRHSVYKSALPSTVTTHNSKIQWLAIAAAAPKDGPVLIAGEDHSTEMTQDMALEFESVVVVDDVLSTGRTLLAILKLLSLHNIKAENIHVMVVVELPAQRGRRLLRDNGFGKVVIQSLLVFGDS